MGELEYYVIAPDSGMFPATDQKGYHESAPMLNLMISAHSAWLILHKPADKSNTDIPK